ncbi:hypothetical protein [Natronosalvus caseinilyticus]|uniref:hypothetical protein n=1 Tax=Natronosalvus caseinilyticus TaxID=2953747 RepID=UPI0028B12ECC|nr:hypothetical protein [Natronosalvus caseinilyticus]
MTTGPKLRLGTSLVPGVLAVVLFAMMALITWNAGLGNMVGFPEGVSITAEIGYAMFDYTALQSGEMGMGNTEPFLFSFLLIAVVLDAALDASLVLAKREEAGEPVTALSTQSQPADSSRSGSAEAATDGGEDR